MYKIHLDPTVHYSKPKLNIGKLRNNLKNNLSNYNLDDFVYKVCNQGCTFFCSVFNGNGTAKSDLLNYPFIVLDIDNTENKEIIKKKEQATLNNVYNQFNNIGCPPFLAYHTFSHSDNCEKFRLVFKFDNPIDNQYIRLLVVNLLVEYFNLNNKAEALDAQASKNPTMFFYGSNYGYTHYNKNNNINLNVLFDNVSKIKKYDLSTKNKSTLLFSRFLNQLNINNVIKYYNDDVVINNNNNNNNNNIKYEYLNDELLVYSSYGEYIYKFFIKLKKDNIIKSNIKSNINIYNKNINELLDHININIKSDELLNKKLLNRVSSHCCIIKKYLNNEYLKHNDRFVLYSFLLNFKNGGHLIKNYVDVIDKKNDTNIESFAKCIYAATGCSKSDSCNRDHNILHLYNQLKKDTIYKAPIKRSSIATLRQKLSDDLDEILATPSTDNSIYILDPTTGVGKTEALFKKTINYDNLIFATYTHNKKDEFKNRVAPDAFIQQELPPLDDLEKKIISNLCIQKKSYIKYLKELKNGKYKNDKSMYKKLDEYINNFYKIHTENKIYCTQAKVPTINNIKNYEGLLVFDEDPEELITNIKNINKSDIDTLKNLLNYKKKILLNNNSNNKIIIKIDLLLNFLKEVWGGQINKLYEVPQEVKIDIMGLFNGPDFNNDKIKNILSSFNTPAFNLFENDVYIVNNEGSITTGQIKNPLPPNAKIIILSATPDLNLYKNLYGDRVKYIKYNKPVNKGNILQKKTKSYSKACINKDEEESINNIINNYNEFKADFLITFKKYKKQLLNGGIPDNKIYNFGAIDGLNIMTGKNVLVAGTFNPDPNYIKVKAKLVYNKYIDFEENTEYMQHQLVTYDNVSFKYYTYTDPIARDIHLHFVWNNSIQATGRGRIVDNKCNVLLLSNFILYDAEQIKDTECIEDFIYELNIKRDNINKFNKSELESIINKCQQLNIDYNNLYTTTL